MTKRGFIVLLGCLAVVSIGIAQERARPTGFVQGQWVMDRSEGGVSPVFRVYRARFGFSGSLTPVFGYNLILGAVEPPDGNPHLVNGYGDLIFGNYLTIRFGQFLVPFGLEGPEAIIYNPAIERTWATRRLNPFNIFRDVGGGLLGRVGPLSYALAFVNGTGANIPDNDDSKDMMGRLGFSPINKFTLGVSGHRGSFADTLKRTRYGVDGEFRSPLRLRGEFIHRQDNDKTSWGWYLLAGYRWGEHWEPVIRYEQYDPNPTTAHDQLIVTLLGLNYYFIGQSRISINYELRDDQSNPELGNLLTIQLQAAL